ncbi:MAG: hypothetical protein HN759_12070 [Akkermansiaceae bacterium]|jgi:hypothetical protein|nr:hypothetical protein [Akkermansiaceae bacterium]
MIRLLLPALIAVFSLSAQAEVNAIEPKYVAESPLPKGWPTPGPYNKVTVKEFPAYRAAYTSGKAKSFAFWRLFRHIKSKDIPMTSPVEMGMEQKGDKMTMNSMGFLYQHRGVGKAGLDSNKIDVRDVPAMKTLSYTWQGKNNSRMMKTAQKAIAAELEKRGIKSDHYRVLGYNGPGVANSKKTWELVAVLPK